MKHYPAFLLALACFSALPARADDANLLPLQPGVYTEKSMPCENPPDRALLIYWGKDAGIDTAFAKCRLKSVSNEDAIYLLREKCTAYALGTTTYPTQRIRILSEKTFETDGKYYRFCTTHLPR